MAVTHLPTRNEIDPRHPWNDASVYTDPDAWAADLEALSAEVDRFAAGLQDLRAERGAVAVAHLVGSGPGADGDDFVPGREHGHADRPTDFDRIGAEHGQRADLGGT